MKQTAAFIGILFLFFCGTVSIVAPVSLQGTVVMITDDGDEWPPYTYYQRVNGEKTDELTGFSIDVIKEILAKNGITCSIKLLPWSRAQSEVEKGTVYSMFLSGSYSDERAKKYYLSEQYYSTSAYYFYSKKRYPNGLPISSRKDLPKYKITGLLGHNYSDYIENTVRIDLGSGDYESMVRQLHAGRYDIFLESLEIITGWSAVNKDLLADKDLGYKKIHDIKSVGFYMMFSRNETGKELKRIVDAGLKEMEKNGRLQALKRKYRIN